MFMALRVKCQTVTTIGSFLFPCSRKRFRVRTEGVRLPFMGKLLFLFWLFICFLFVLGHGGPGIPNMEHNLPLKKCSVMLVNNISGRFSEVIFVRTTLGLVPGRASFRAI